MSTGVALGALVAIASVTIVVWLVVRAVRSRPSARPSIDPFSVPEPWRRPVGDALAARRRIDAAVASMAPGPLRDRMSTVGGRLDEGLDRLGEVARLGAELSTARRRIDLRDLERRMSATSDRATREALRAQVDAAGRLDATIADAEARLGRLVARLEQAATGAEGLAVRVGDTTAADTLDEEVTGAVSEVEALGAALDEARAAGGTAASGGPT